MRNPKLPQNGQNFVRRAPATLAIIYVDRKGRNIQTDSHRSTRRYTEHAWILQVYQALRQGECISEYVWIWHWSLPFLDKNDMLAYSIKASIAIRAHKIAALLNVRSHTLPIFGLQLFLQDKRFSDSTLREPLIACGFKLTK